MIPSRLPAVAALCVASLFAQSEPERASELELGDPAPAWTVDEWLHGDEIAALTPGKVYYVEFWATWCAPCIAGFPHLSKLQEKHGSDTLIVVGVSIDEAKPLSELRSFVTGRVESGDIRFRVAWDSTGRMADAWLAKALVSGIPASVVIDQRGRIAFLGSASAGAKAVPRILDGTWDLQAARERRRAPAKQQARRSALTRRYFDCIGEKRWRDALAVVDELEALEGQRLPGHDQTRLSTMLQANYRDEAFRLADARMKGEWKDEPAMLHIIVQCYAFDLKRPLFDRERALLWQCVARAALTASDPLDYKNTVAVAHYACAEYEAAERLQTELVTATQDRDTPRANAYRLLLERTRKQRVLLRPQPEAVVDPPTATLAVGDMAPPCVMDYWLRGDPVRSFEPGHVYVLDFWATWCGPCIASMPHLSDLQQSRRSDGLTVIAVTSKDSKNSLAGVTEAMATRLRDVAVSFLWDPDGKVRETWLESTRSTSLPTSLLIDRSGRIAFIGHPMWIDRVAERVLDGTWDPDVGMAEIDAARAQLDEIFRNARKAPAASLAQLDALERRFPAVAPVLRFTRYRLLVRTGDPRLGPTGRRMLEAAVGARDAETLTAIAWELLDPQATPPNRDLELASLATAALVQLQGDDHPGALMMRARVQYLSGDRALAIKTQQQAVAAATDEGQRAYMQKLLAELMASAK